MIIYDPKNWFRILLDFPRSPVFPPSRSMCSRPVRGRRWSCGWDGRHPCGRTTRSEFPVDPRHHPRSAARVPDEHLCTTAGGRVGGCGVSSSTCHAVWRISSTRNFRMRLRSAQSTAMCWRGSRLRSRRTCAVPAAIRRACPQRSCAGTFARRAPRRPRRCAAARDDHCPDAHHARVR